MEFDDKVDEIRIGRRTDLELSLPFKALSTVHARLLRKRSSEGERGHAWLIEDLDSKNGTFVGKKRLKEGEQRLMFAGDRIDLGPVKVLFDGHAAPISGAEGTATIARRLVNDMLLASPGAGAPTLSVISGTSEVETLKLLDRDRPYFIGRAKSCDMCFPLDELSRQHASFTRTWNGVVLRDQGSKNGVQVNGITVISQRLRDGDEIEVGPLKLRLLDPEDKYLRDVEGGDRAERAPRGDSAPKPVVVMPAAMAVSLPVLPTPAPATLPTPADGDAPPKKVSRLAPRPTAEPTGAAPPPSAQPQTLDVHHPAISARRPPPDVRPNETHEQTMVKRARKTMYFALTVLAIIAITAVALVLGSN
ncbi:MAG TPA: FHA domain-containing protein [Polyangia bacterium]|nr:FHA domain-containing protein [Polyangia bacterium]